MSNVESSETYHSIHETDQNEQNEVTTGTSEMAVQSFPECSDRAPPISGSACPVETSKLTLATRHTDEMSQPTNDKLTHDDQNHVSDHIRETMSGLTPITDSTCHQASLSQDFPSATHAKHEVTNRLLTNDNQAVLDEALEVMSIGTHGNEPSSGDKSETPESGPFERSMDDTSENSSKGARRKRSDQLCDEQAAGRWTPEEHQEFLDGLKVFGREWKKVAERIPTRTSAQIRSHAQKYFAKLVRDESMILQDRSAVVIATPTRPEPSMSVEVVPNTPFVLSESVKRKVDRILADPTNVEREVEETLQALRERYLQLQLRLEESNRMNSGLSSPAGQSHVVESEDINLSDMPVQARPIVDRRKRALDERSDDGMFRHHHDDMSSISSTCFSPTRDLVDEELIAISVLGGSLQRSASQQDLQPTASFEEYCDHHGHSQVHESCADSTTHDNRKQSDESDSRSDQSKKLKLSDEDSDSSINESNEDENNSLNRDDMAL